MVGAAVLGPWAALAVWLGNFLYPWGGAVGPLRTAVFGLPEVTFCLLCVVAMQRAEAKTEGKLVHVAVWGIALGTLASAILGTFLLAVLPPPGVGRVPPGVVLSGLAWWFADLAAALTLGLAGTVLVRSSVLLHPQEQAVLKIWWQRGGLQKVLVSTLALAVMSFLLVFSTGARPHWFALLFAPTLAIAAFAGGTGAALLTNGLVSGLYLTLVVLVGGGQVQAVTVELVSAYGQVFLFSIMAWLLGWQSATNRTLLEQVKEQSLALEGALDEVARLLAQALEAKEPGSQGHAQRVATLAHYVGTAMGMGEDELKLLRRSALLHDIGKLGVPEAVLNQLVTMEPERKRRLQQSMVESLKQLGSGVSLLQPIAQVVAAVGERYDGQHFGSSRGNQWMDGSQLPLAARIIAPICAYDAMTHPKVWRRSKTREEAVAELWRCSGGQFDPEVVQKFTEIIREQWDLEAEPSGA